jgi:ABC-type multidrug transport system fused ATPase/permease subunit
MCPMNSTVVSSIRTPTYYRFNCTCGVVYRGIIVHVFIQIMNGWWLKHRVSKFVVLMYIFYLTVIWVTIKSHQSNQTRSTTWWTLINCEYSCYFIPFYNLQYMYMYYLSSLRAIFTKYSNSTTEQNNWFNSNQAYMQNATCIYWWQFPIWNPYL